MLRELRHHGRRPAAVDLLCRGAGQGGARLAGGGALRGGGPRPRVAVRVGAGRGLLLRGPSQPARLVQLGEGRRQVVGGGGAGGRRRGQAGLLPTLPAGVSCTAGEVRLGAVSTLYSPF